MTGALLSAVLLLLNGCGENLTDAQYVERARESRDKGEVPASIIDLKNALQQNPANVEAHSLLGQIYVEIDDGASAEKELRRALDQGAAVELVAVPLAKSLLLQGKFADVLAVNATISQLNEAARAELFALRGRAYLGQGKVDEAAEQFRLALAAKPDSPAALLGQALLAFQKEQWDEARRWNDKVLAVAPTFAEAHALQGDLALVKNNFAEAESAYQQAVNAKPLHFSYRVGLAIAQINAGKLDQAISQLNVILKVIPDYPFGNYLRALAAFQKKNFEEAQLYAEKALSVETNDLRSRLIAGTASYYLGKFQQAKEHLTLFVAQVPNYAPALKLLAATQLQLGSTEKAAATLKPVVARSENDAQLFAAIGQAALRGGDLRLGRELFEEAVKAQPDQAAARVQLGLTKVMLGEREQGIDDLQQALELDPKLRAAEDALILTHLRAGEYDKALDVANHMREQQPNSPVPLNYIGAAYIGKGDQDKAREAFQQALQIAPGDPMATNGLAVLELRKGEVDKARSLYQETLKYHPDNLQTLMQIAALAFAQGRIEEAKSWVEQAMQKNPKALEPRVTLATYYLRVGQPRQALTLTQEIQDLYPDNPALLAVIGNAQLANNEPANALSTFQKLVQTQPKSAQVHYLLAKAYGAMNNAQKAREELQQALELEPNHFLSKLAMTRMLMEENKPAEANKLLSELTQVQPQHPEVMALKGWLAMRQNRPKEAVEAFKEALKQAPNDSNFTVYLALAQWQTDDQEGSMVTLKKWLEEHPKDWLVQYHLANSYLLLNRLEEAKSAFAKVIELSPNHVLSLNNLAWLLRKDDPAKALKYAEHALELAPDAPPVMDTLGTLLLDQGQTERASRLFRNASEKAPANLDLRYHLALALVRSGNKDEARKILQGILAEHKPFENKQDAESLLQSLGG